LTPPKKKAKKEESTDENLLLPVEEPTDLKLELEKELEAAKESVGNTVSTETSHDGFSFDQLAIQDATPEPEKEIKSNESNESEEIVSPKEDSTEKGELLESSSTTSPKDRSESRPRKKHLWRAYIAFDRNLNERGKLQDSFQDLTRLLQDYAFKCFEFNDVMVQPRLVRYDVVIFACPDHSKFNPVEIKNLVRYVKNGGSLILLSNAGGDHGRGTNLNALSREFGITFQNNQVTDEVNNNGIPTLPMISKFADHPAVKGVKEVCLRSACSLEIAGNARPVAWADAIADPTNACVMAVAEVGLGKVICIGSWEMFRNKVLKWFYHEKLFMSMIEWAIEKHKDHRWIQTIDFINAVMGRTSMAKVGAKSGDPKAKGSKFQLPVLPAVSKGSLTTDDLQLIIDGFNDVLVAVKTLQDDFENLKLEIKSEIADLKGYNSSITRELTDFGSKLDDIKDYEEGLSSALMDLGKNLTKLMKHDHVQPIKHKKPKKT